MKPKLPKLKQRKGVNISRACWEMVIEEHKRTDKDYQLIVELAIKKMLGKK